jgi:hypothetical protein
MKFSWRKSRDSLTDTDDYSTTKRRHRHHSLDGDDDNDNDEDKEFDIDDDDNDENDDTACCFTEKHVHFNGEEGNEELVITPMPILEDDLLLYEDDIIIRWLQVRCRSLYELDSFRFHWMLIHMVSYSFHLSLCCLTSSYLT